MLKIVIVITLIIIIVFLLNLDNFRNVPTINEQKKENINAEKYLSKHEDIIDKRLENKAWNPNNTIETQNCSSCHKAPT